MQRSSSVPFVPRSGDAFRAHTSDACGAPGSWRALPGSTLCLVLVLLTGSAVQAQGVVDTTPPVIVSTPVLTQSTQAFAPLVATLHVVTDEPTQIDLGIHDAQRFLRLVPETGYSTVHDTLVLGLQPGTTHRVSFGVRDAAGNRTIWPGAFAVTTPALPPSFPPIHVTTSQTDRMEPGLTLLSTFYTSPQVPGTGTYLMLIDDHGRIVWWYSTRDSLIYVTRMRNGHLLGLASPYQIEEIDMRGYIVARWWARGGGLSNAPLGATIVDVDQFHHDVEELPANGPADFICLSTELRTYPNYPADEVNTSITDAQANVVGDVVVEFNRDGTVVKRTKLLDVLDPYRICYGSLGGFNNALYGVTTRDWAHCNAAALDMTDDSYIVSARHQDCVCKIRRSDGQLLWIQGPHDRWNAPWTGALLTSIGAPFGWNYHEHGPHIDASGNLTMFDNGNYRVTPPVQALPPSQWYSRAVRFHIDPVAMTTEQVWSYDGGGHPYFSGFLGDARPLPATGNVLVTDGAKQVPGFNKTYARVFEVTTGQPGDVVFEAIVNDPAVASNPYNWNIYRSQRWPSMYVGP